MTSYVFANNINTTLSAGISGSATSITLASSINLPASIPVGKYFVITLSDAATRSNFEIVYATAISGSTLTVLRAQEGTVALSWLAGDYAYSPPTAGQMESFGGGNYVPLSGNSTVTGNLVLAPTSGNASLTLNAPTPSTDIAQLIGQSNGITLWALEMPDGTAQGGANSGGNFTLSAYSDTGVLLFSPIKVNRATGAVTLSAGITATTVTAPTATFATSLSAGAITASGGYSGTSGAFSAALSSVGYSGTAGTFTGTVTAAAFNVSSDRTLKTNIRPRKVQSGFALRVARMFSEWDRKLDGVHDVGLIAQRVKAFAARYVIRDGNGKLAIDKSGIALEASMDNALQLQELSRRLAKLESGK